MSWRAVPGPDGPALLAARGRDDAWPRLMISGQAPPLTAIAKVLAAVAFSILMGLSRAYLGAHWLSDAVAGILLGLSCAIVTALVVGQIQRRAEGRQGAA